MHMVRKGMLMHEREIKELQKIIDDSKAIVFFGGAGVSTESGIPVFRRSTMKVPTF